MDAPSITLPDAHRVTSSWTMVPKSPDVLGHSSLLGEQGEAPEVAHGNFWQVREDAHPAKSTATLNSGMPAPSLRFHPVRKRLFPPEKN